MAQIITIPNDNDSVMIAERARIGRWAVANGWIYFGYNDQPDHVVQIAKAAAGAALDILDFDCHGNPTTFGHTSDISVAAFGQQLSQVPGFSANTQIYLDACNTGLVSRWGGPIAQALADAAGCTVYGTSGYMTGTYAENTEQCYDTINGYPRYPGAQSQLGRDVWIKFEPSAMMSGNMINASTINLKTRPAGEKAESESFGESSREAASMRLANVIEDVLKGDRIEFPQLRMAPDITVNYDTGTSVQILDIFANGGLIKDRMSGITWQVSERNVEELQAAIENHLNEWDGLLAGE